MNVSDIDARTVKMRPPHPRKLEQRQGLLLSSKEDIEEWCRAAGDVAVDIAVLSFGRFRLDLTNEILWRGTQQLPLCPKPLSILRYLAEHPQRLVRQQELVEGVWGRVVTSESLLRTHVCTLRQVLGEGVIETVIRRGYRFVLDVTRRAEVFDLTRRDRTALSAVDSVQV
jgi:DNA-binding winged helix-turn-helix (wHTH) protein